MALELKQSVKLSQQLVMTPQLQMAIKLLTLNRLELSDAIQAELVENPVLEESLEEPKSAVEAREQEQEKKAEPTETAEVQIGDVGTEKQKDNSDDIDWEAYAESYSHLPTGGGGGRDNAFDDMPGIDQTLSRAETLEEHLHWQLQMSDFNSLERTIGERLLGEMNDIGYLDMAPPVGDKAAADKTTQSPSEPSAAEKRAAAPAAKVIAPSEPPKPAPKKPAKRARRKTTAERLRELAAEQKAHARGPAPAPAEPRKPAPVLKLDANDPVKRIADEMEFPVEWIESVRSRMQRFDPPGCLSRDLRECLLVQLDLWGYDDETLCYNIVDRHMPDVEARNFRGIARALKVPMAEVGEAFKLIEKLEPKPGRNFEPMGKQPGSEYITPDVYVHRMKDEYVVVPNEDGLPKLQLSRFYLDALRSQKRGDPSKSFIKDKMRSATWLIRSIHQRQRTIFKVVESIVKFQKQWFDGTGPLAPLVLKDVADDIEMHESTVSRVTTRKYVHTHRGVYELKYFFNSSIATAGGDGIASESVKDEIRKLIAAENPKKPLSDAKIVGLLSENGIDIARRTVAKYREMLGILPSSKRRQVF